jgi:hypothetical protein
MNNNIFLLCPHCNLLVHIEQINCGIFRHGIFIKTNEQIPPHLPKDKCDELIKNNEIYGCGKPFQIIKIEEEWKLIICDYI